MRLFFQLTHPGKTSFSPSSIGKSAGCMLRYVSRGFSIFTHSAANLKDNLNSMHIFFKSRIKKN